MRNLLLFVIAATIAVGCSRESVDELTNSPAVEGRSLVVSLDEEGDETRIQLNEAQKTVWNEGDLVSVFYRSTVNEQWQFQGKTGDRTGNILPVDSSIVPPATGNDIVVVYPYNEGYFYNSDTKNVQASLPTEQTYLKDSYGINGNIMVSSSEYNNISLKNVCGWLKVQLTGAGEEIESITVRGNSGEQLAGELYINTSDATSTLASQLTESDDDSEVSGTLVRPGTILTEVTLNCLDGSSPTEKGVALGAEATSFYIALPPQTFKNGISVEITAVDGSTMTKSTDNEVVIERNHIKPMTAFKFVNPNTPTLPTPANNEIWYTATEKVEPYDKTVFGATYVSNEWDSETGKGVITFDKDITEIGYWAFYNCRSLTSMTIPDSVTTIGDDAFYQCYNLTSVTIPDSVTTIGEMAFYCCYSLASVTIPDSVTTIGEGAFWGCTSLTSVTIGDSVTTIGDLAFYGCRSLKEFKGKFAADGGRCLIKDNTIIAYAEASGTTYTIPDCVTAIGKYAFFGCISLTSVTIPDSVTKIGESSFQDCISLTSVTIPDSVTTIGDGAFSSCHSLTSVTIGNSVKTIGEGAFAWCKSLKEFKGKFAADGGRCLIIDGVLNAFAIGCGVNQYTIPDSVTTIGKEAFYYCDSLISVTIPDSVTTIGEWAFYYCKSLKYVYCKPTTPPTGGDRMFYENAPDLKIYVPASADDSIINAYKAKQYWSDYKGSIFEIGENVDTIKPANNEILYTATEKVEPYFTDEFGATYLSNVWDSETGRGVITFEGDVTKIGYYAFYGYQTGCNKLTSVTIPDSVTTIGEYAFSDCNSLTSVTIGNSVTTIGEYAFFRCKSLTSVTIPDSVTTIGDYAFWSCGSLTSVTIGNSVTTIGEEAFCDCDSLTSVTIPNSVTTIGNWAFSGCTSLTSVTIPDSVTTIGECAFNFCRSLTSVTIPDSVTTIGNRAFSYCDSLTSVTIPDSVTTIGEAAFADCRSLTSVTIPDSVTTIGDWAFSSCSSLTSVTIPDSVTTIGYRAFYYCDSLLSVTIGKSVTSLANNAFEGCTGELIINSNIPSGDIEARPFFNSKFTKVTIGDSVTTIGERAFDGCNSLTSVTISNSVTTIGDWAFSGCTSLKEFKGKFAADGGRCLIIDGVLNAFALGCGVTQYTTPNSVTTIGNSAFSSCSSLTSVTIGNSVKTIGSSAFSSCSSLTSVTIGNSVTKIGEYAFRDCESLTSVTIPDGVTTIGEWAFGWCDSLTSVTIGNSVTTIGEAAFRSCDSLKTVYCKPTTPPTGSLDMFYNNAPGRRIFVPTSADDSIINAYKAAKYWSDYASNIFEEE